jgi:uncharacterized protein
VTNIQKETAFHIAVFCRPLVVGEVKTRLIPQLGEAAAADIYAQLAERVLTTVQKTIHLANASGSLWIAGDANHPSVTAWSQQFSLPVYAQCEGDLGAKMADCLARSRAYYSKTILIGTDCPAITPEHLICAAGMISNQTPWVFSAAEDGGYVLVGTRAPHSAPFENIAWGTDRVMTQTRSAFARMGIGYAETSPLWDVDHPSDVARARAAGFLR